MLPGNRRPESNLSDRRRHPPMPQYTFQTSLKEVWTFSGRLGTLAIACNRSSHRGAFGDAGRTVETLTQRKEHTMKTWMPAALVAALLTTTVARADVLLDQSDYDEFGAGYFDSESGEPPFGVTVHGVNDISVGGDGWTVDSITTYYSFLDPGWGTAITQAYLHVFPKTGPLPIDGANDPTMSPLVSASSVPGAGIWIVSASGLALDLAPGEYWIGITPIAPSGPFGPEIHLSSHTFIGDETASYDPFGFPAPTWFHFNPDLDAAMKIEGTIHGPVPTVESTWGRVKSDFRN